MVNQNNKIPTWFTVVSILFLLWNLMGCMAFFSHVMMPEAMLEKMTQEEQELYASIPLWSTIAFALGVFGGALGSIGLVMKKKWAKSLFWLSLLGVMVQTFQSLVLADTLTIYGSGAALLPLLIVLLTAVAVWFAQYGITKRWLK